MKPHLPLLQSFLRIPLSGRNLFSSFFLSSLSVDIVLLSFIGVSVLTTNPHPNGHAHFNVLPPYPGTHT